MASGNSAPPLNPSAAAPPASEAGITLAWPRDALPFGTELFGYRIAAILGRGGFGITYRATDRIDQEFAIKECYPRQFATRQNSQVFPADDAEAPMFTELLSRFTKEARSLTMFSKSGAAGEGMVKVITFFEANGTAYIVMELLEGQSLERLIDSNPEGVAEPALLNILRPLLTSLACVHANGLTHRDIKPANIFLRRDGRPVLLDFGAARAVQADHATHFTQIYTESYGPIEQMQGLPQGAFSDLYSLGITCYQMIAGTRFRNAPAALQRYHAAFNNVADPLTSAATLGAGRYHPALLAAIDQLIQVAPEDRPVSVEAFLPSLADCPDSAATRLPSQNPSFRPPETDIEATIIGGAQLTTVIASALPPAPQPASRSLAPAIIVVACLAVAGAVVAGVYLDTRPSKLASVPPETSQPTAPAAPADTIAPQTAAAAYGAHDYPAAFRLARATAANDPQASFLLGMMYQRGLGTSADPIAALGWFRRAAQAGIAEAASQIGTQYQFGLGVRRDPAEAARWYRQGADQGSTSAEAQLGYLLFTGQGIQKDIPTALHWLQLAGAQNSASAEYLLGTAYEQGIGAPADPAAAFSQYQRAADQGLATAQYELGRLYAAGIGTARDPAAARQLMSRAAAGGNPRARAWLAQNPA